MYQMRQNGSMSESQRAETAALADILSAVLGRHLIGESYHRAACDVKCKSGNGDVAATLRAEFRGNRGMVYRSVGG